MEVSEIAETVGVVTSITLSAMSASLRSSIVASAEASTILTLGSKPLHKKFTKKRQKHHLTYQVCHQGVVAYTLAVV